MAHSPAQKVMEKVLSAVRIHKPFYGALLFRLKVREARPSEGVPTMAVDGKTMVYNPQFVMTRTFEDLVFIVVHEITHCVLGHPERSRKPREDKDTWQEACDHAVNLTLKRDTTMRLPFDATADSKFEGMLAETIYECLMRDKAAQQAQQQQQAKQKQEQQEQLAAGPSQSTEGGSQPSPNEEKEDGSEDESEGEAGEGEGEATDDRSESPEPDHAGSGEGAEHHDSGAAPEPEGGRGEEDSRSDEQAAGAGGGDVGSESGEGAEGEAQGEAPEQGVGTQHGDVVASGSLSEAGDEAEGIEEKLDDDEAEALSEEWAEAVIAASVIDQGGAAAAMARSVGKMLTPPRSMEEEVERFMVEKVQGVDDWSRQNRRFRDVYLPQCQSIGAHTMVYLIDTSGSVGDGDIARMERVVQQVSERLRVQHSVVVYCDAVVTGTEHYYNEPPRFERPIGGGGTRFDPALQEVLDLKQRDGLDIAGVIYLTDQMGMLSEPGKYAELPLLWVNVDPRFLQRMPIGEVCSM